MSYLDIGLSAIRANQVALQTVSNNIANAGTEGYHRQRVDFETRNPAYINGLSIGRGVDVSNVRRIIDFGVESSLTRYRNLSADAQTRLDTRRRVESILTPGSGSLDVQVSNFFDALEQLAARPSESFLRTQLINASRSLAGQVNAAASELDQVSVGIERELRSAVEDVNRLTSALAELDQRIRVEQASGRDPADLQDRRGNLINELSALVGVDPRSLDITKGPVIAANGWLVVTEDVSQMQVYPTTDGGLTVRTDTQVGLTTGKIAALLSSLKEVKDTKQQIVDWFQDFRYQVDHLQATGLGAGGPRDFVQSTRRFENPAARLSQLPLPVDVSSGDLYITVTNTATGARTTHRVNINVQTDTLADVASKIDAIPNISAVVNSTGELRIVGSPGFKFDFAGRLDQAPATSAITGTTTPTISGLYTGNANAQWRISAVDSGTVGVDQPLRLEVRDVVTGDLITTLDVGQGYEAGSPIEIKDGVKVSFAAGAFNAADQFTITPVAEPDETRLLSALGIGSFFTGDGPGTFDVNPALVTNPDGFAFSRTGLAGDVSNLQRWIDLRDRKIFGNGADTVEGRLASMIASIGIGVQATQSEVEQLESVQTRLEADRDSVSGVDVNEELLLMLRYQQAFQAAARFVTAIDGTLQELMKIVG